MWHGAIPLRPLAENLPEIYRHKNTYVEVRKNPPAVGLTTTKVKSGNRPQAGYPTTNHRRNPNETEKSRSAMSQPCSWRVK